MRLHHAATPQVQLATEEREHAIMDKRSQYAGLLAPGAIGSDLGDECIEIWYCYQSDKSDDAIRYWPDLRPHEHVAWNERFAAFEWSYVAEHCGENCLALGAHLDDF